MNSPLAKTLAAEEEKLLACVHCGLCLESCPTYVATGNENDSPRGRIYLMRAVAEGRLDVETETFERHIDRCLGCRACEAACPAAVQYGQLLEVARSEVMKAHHDRGLGYSVIRFVLRHIWSRPALLRASFALSRIARDLRIPDLLIRTGLAVFFSPRFEFALALLDSSRPAAPASDNQVERTKSTGPATTVFLFEACVTNGLFRRVNEATRRVLSANNTVVSSPAGQVCCGALHAHAGDLEGAKRLARQNIDAFDRNTENMPRSIITNAGGCGAMLVTYSHLLADDDDYSARAKDFSRRVCDIGQYLQQVGIRKGTRIGPERITYDASCHLLHGQHAAAASLQMVQSIPHLNFVPLNGSDTCCGGAGVYNLLEPELSSQVLKEKLRHITESGAEVLATGNAGCHMQIAAGARLAEINLRVCHPVELLDDSYERAGVYAEPKEA